MKTYPVFLIGLETRRCIVLGGGREAERKVQGLLDAGAAVTVIAGEITKHLDEQVRAGLVQWVARDWREGDLRGAFLVIATGSDRQVNEPIWREAEAAGALINVVDDAAHCSFTAGSIVRRGDLAVAISTGGAAPALAVRLRERLEAELGPEYADLLELLAGLRNRLAVWVPDFEERRALWYELVDSAALAELRAGRREPARQRLEALARERAGSLAR